MDSHSPWRRTNRIDVDTQGGYVFKQYRDDPWTVLPQVWCALRPPSSLSGYVRCRREQLKVEHLQRSGIVFDPMGFTIGRHQAFYLDRRFGRPTRL